MVFPWCFYGFPTIFPWFFPWKLPQPRLILDEPTAAMDAEAEAQIFERLASLTAEQSALLISAAAPRCGNGVGAEKWRRKRGKIRRKRKEKTIENVEKMMENVEKTMDNVEKTMEILENNGKCGGNDGKCGENHGKCGGNHGKLAQNVNMLASGLGKGKIEPYFALKMMGN